MKTFLLQFFTWWNGQTLGTRFWTWRKGEPVGADRFGNRYFRERNGGRRWVVYNGLADPSAIPPGWHAWMHHRTDQPPVEGAYKAREWEQPHRPNPTGSPQAYRPPGSILNQKPRIPGRPDYDAWSP